MSNTKTVVSPKGVMRDITGIIDEDVLHKYIIDLIHNIDHNNSRRVFFDFRASEITIGYDQPATIEQVNKMVSYYTPSDSHHTDDNMSTRGVGRIFIPYAYPGFWHVVTQADDNTLACAGMNTRTILEKLNNPTISDTDMMACLSGNTEYAEKYEAYEDILVKKPQHLVDYFGSGHDFPFSPKLLLNARRITKKSNPNPDKPFSFTSDPKFNAQYWDNVRRYIAINAQHLLHAQVDPVQIFMRFPNEETFTDLSTMTTDIIGWHSFSMDDSHPYFIAIIYKTRQTLPDRKIVEGGRSASKNRKKQETHTILPDSYVYRITPNDESKSYFVVENGKNPAIVIDIRPEDMTSLREIAKQTFYFNTNAKSTQLPSTDSNEGAYAGTYLMTSRHITGSVATGIKFDSLFRQINGTYTRFQLRSVLELKTIEAKTTLAVIEKVKYDSSLSLEGKHITEFLAKRFVNYHVTEDDESSDGADSTGTAYCRIVGICTNGDFVVKTGYTKQEKSKKRSKGQPEDQAHPWITDIKMPLSVEPFELSKIHHSEMYEKELFTIIEAKSKNAAKCIQCKYSNLKLREYFKLPAATYLELIEDMKKLAQNPKYMASSVDAAHENVLIPEHAAPVTNHYHEFVKSIRPTVKAEHPDWTPQEIITEIGRLWTAKKAERVEVK